ncbi:MAG: AAA family ATPase [Desulfobacteraceae bacterium]|nr:AAA family ATPase [Desulfobacteraceae bacterium]MBC2754185.1 AAA family ATPase [Desulfobacteraceae bacterium]
MKCPKCEHDNREEARFCDWCAYPLQAQEQAPPIDFTQPHSYTPKFLADKILTTRSAMEGERKRVTVLFADVAGFTSMSEKLDPEQVHQIMDGCFKILMEQIHNHQGTINQFTGDGVMALFGAPLALEDHAQDACQAALAIQSAIKKYSEELQKKFGFEFKMRIGLNSGPVIVGSIGDDLRMDYTAIGDTTNLAARMESMAAPGTILVSPVTYKRVSQQFDFNPLGEAKVKGKEVPLDVYELIKAKVDRPRLGLERQIYSEMVGRDNDLNKLELQVNKASSGEGSIVNIIGEAGIGKSRLIAELRNSSVMKRITLLEGRAISIGRNLSFHPIINLLKHWSRIKEDDNSSTAISKLETAIRSVCPEDTDEIFAFVATLMGMKLSGRHAERLKGIEGEGLEKLILKNVKDLIIKSTELTPLVIVTEDLHWADTSSIELLESLFTLAETQRILFINVFRPNHPETGDRIVETIKEKLPVYYVEVNLKPLNEQMSETLINNMLNIRGLQLAVVDQIILRSGGNPFFIEEVVRSFIDEGAVVKTNGEFEVTDKIEKMVIPHTINDVLMARIDRLDDNTRGLVRVASVIGRSFFYRILIEVAKTVDGIDNRLSYLKQIELIRERQRMEELEYLFKHALAQEAAYDSILHQKQKEIHLQVARSIEKVFNERLHEFYGMLALHYSKGEDYEKAEHYLVKAGEEAIRSSASSEAVQYYQEALSLYLKKYRNDADPQKVAMMESNIALSLHNRGQFFEAGEFFDKTIAYYGEKSPKHMIPMALKFTVCFSHFLISLYFPALKFKRMPDTKDVEVLNLFYKKLSALAITDPKRFFIESFYFLRRLSNFDLTKVENGVGMYGGASATFAWPGVSFRLSRKVLDFAKSKADKGDVKFKINYNMVVSLYGFVTGNWNLAKEYDEDLVNQSLRIGQMEITSIYNIFHGFINIDQGRFHVVQTIVDKLSEMAEVYENVFSRAHKYEVNLKLLLKQRKLHSILDEIEEGINFGHKIGMKIYVFVYLLYKARVQILLNNIDGAEESLSLSYAREYQAAALPLPYYHGYLLLTQFILNLHRLEAMSVTGDKSQIKKIQNDAIKFGKKAIKKSRKATSERTETLKLMGTYYWLIGKQKKALKWWNKSIKEGERLGARLELSRTYFEVGKRLLEPNSKYKELNNITAEEYLEKARTLFEEMELQWDLDELDKV